MSINPQNTPFLQEIAQWNEETVNSINERLGAFGNIAQVSSDISELGLKDILNNPSYDTVVLGEGTFSFSESGLTPNRNINIIGAGMDKTFLDFSAVDQADLGDANAGIYVSGTDFVALPALSGDVSKGDVTLTFASAPGLAVGDVFVIYNDTASSWSGFDALATAGEWCEVVAVSGNAVTLRNPLYDDYAAADVDLYECEMVTGNFKGFTILMPPGATTEPTYGLRVRKAHRSVISEVSVKDASATALLLERSYKCWIENCDLLEDASSDHSTDYGISMSNCQGIRVNDCHVFAHRHAIMTGGSAAVGAVVCRDIIVNGCTLRSTELQAADNHSNSEYITWVNNLVFGGFTCGGDHLNFFDNTVVGPYNNGNVAFLFKELLGPNIIIDGGSIRSDQVGTSSRGAFIDIGGNTDVLTSNTTRGGQIRVSNIDLFWDITSAESSDSPIVMRNRGATVDIDLFMESVNIIQANTTQRGAVDLRPVSGDGWRNVEIAKCTFTGLDLRHSVANTAAVEVFNAVGCLIQNADSFGMLVNDINLSGTVKNCHFENIELYACALHGIDSDPADYAEMLVCEGNTANNILQVDPGAVSQRSGFHCWYAEMASIRNNTSKGGTAAAMARNFSLLNVDDAYHVGNASHNGTANQTVVYATNVTNNNTL